MHRPSQHPSRGPINFHRSTCWNSRDLADKRAKFWPNSLPATPKLEWQYCCTVKFASRLLVRLRTETKLVFCRFSVTPVDELNTPWRSALITLTMTAFDSNSGLTVFSPSATCRRVGLVEAVDELKCIQFGSLECSINPIYLHFEAIGSRQHVKKKKKKAALKAIRE